MRKIAPVHNLRPNETTWTPPVVATLDTETRHTMTDGTETHVLRCWNAQLRVRRDKRKTVEREESEEGMFASDAAFTVAAWNRKHPTLWVYCHNLAFDMTTSEITTHLADLGYTVTDFAIDSPSPFVKMTNGRCHITLADSFSWLPGRLEDVASKMRMVKPPLPGNEDDDAWWLARCRADAEILSAAMTTIMDWWDDNRLGHWSITGSASGWNVMRHIIDARRFTINTAPDGIAFDRRAIYGGRRGMFRAGNLPAGNYADIDFSAAYPTVASSLPLPHERMAHFSSLPIDHRWLTSDRHGVIATVRLRTDVPRWPVRADNRVWYPVGEFETVLAGPDIAEAIALGCLVSVGEGWVHRLGFALRPWAEWCLEISGGADESAPEVVRMWAKHCGRAVIGKWAQRAFNTIEIGPAPRRGWWASDGWNHTEGCRATIIDFDGRRWQASASGDGDNCYPAVLAWVEAYVRVRLNRMLESMPDGAPVACDTDGALIDMDALGTWDEARVGLAPLVPRAKGHYSTVETIGPQHMILDGRRRFAGVPAAAKVNEDGSLDALLWPKLVWQMGNGRPGEYTRPTQNYRVSATYAPGWVLAGGDVLPVETQINDAGETVLMSWRECRWGRMGYALAAEQNKDLGRYADGRNKESA
jgi:hypothetical protein